MVVDSILTNIPTPVMTFGGSMIAGFCIGMLLKRVLKILLIIVGSFFGVLFIAIQYMSHKGYLNNQINWDRIGSDTVTSFHRLATQFSPHGIFSFLGIEATSGLAVGTLLGIAKG